ncbi:MAG: heavy metal translocating P-type ATPase, partial [Armatimonadetes bacterium]|nr:heavy metal translocating P-type ATPase [Armatimonadota bacterium]
MATLTRLDIPVEGMHCAGCASRIEKKLQSLPGVEEASVNFATRRASVFYDSSNTGPAPIVEAVNTIGFSALIQEFTFSILGMHCASCVKRIEDSVLGIPGVLQASVNLASGKAFVRTVSDAVSPSDLMHAIVRAGPYQVLEAPPSEAEEAPAEKREREDLAALRGKVIANIALAAVIMLVSMLHMSIMKASDLPLESINFLLFALATPVQLWGGWQFYKTSFQVLKGGGTDMNVLIAMGTSAAYFYSVVVTFAPQFFPGATGEAYFDTAAVIIALVLLGRYLEAGARGRTSEAIRKLSHLRPKSATVLREGKEEEIPQEKVQPGDLVVVRPGERIPVDGLVREGQSAVDE